jgi:hypothetical protein
MYKVLNPPVLVDAAASDTLVGSPVPNLCPAAFGYAISIAGFGWYNKIKMGQIASAPPDNKVRVGG